MNNIEFRAKVKDLGEWVYGYYLKCQDEHYICSTLCMYHADIGNLDILGKKSFSMQMYVVDENSIEMWSGMYDKFGNKIFENDIVKDNYGRFMRVIFNEQKAKFQFKLIEVIGEHAHWANNFVVADFADWFENGNVYVEVVGEVNEND